MSIPIVSQIPSPYATLVLLILLIVAFVIAFKIMEMVFETLLITVLSGGFYVTLVYLFELTFSLNDMLFYAFLGAALYMAYSFLASAYSIISRVLEIPYRSFLILLIPFKMLYRKAREEWKLREIRDRGVQANKKSGKSRSEKTKEVVLDKVRKDEEED